MKKLLVLVLILCLSVSPALAESHGPFTYNTLSEARSLALACLKNCAFVDPKGNQWEWMVRWVDRIYVQVKGSPTQEDREELNRFLVELSLRVPEMPGVFMTDDDEKANFTIHYEPQNQLPNLFPDYGENDTGYFLIWITEAHEINRGMIGLASDVNNQRQRNFLMRKLLVRSLGLCSEHDLYDDSILYRSSSDDVQTLSEVDWLMLNMLYSPYAKPGMSYGQVHEIVEYHYIR